MESSATISSSSSQEKPDKKSLSFGIGVGIGYGLLTSIVVFPVTFIVSFFLLNLVDVYVYSTASYSFDAIMLILGILSFLISLVFGGVVGFFSGRSAYRSANESGTIRNAGFGVLSCGVVGLIGFLVFPLLCGALYFGILLVMSKISSSIPPNPVVEFLFGVIAGGSESGMAGMLLVVVPVFGIFTAYVVALISGALTHRILVRRSAVSKNDSKSEVGVL